MQLALRMIVLAAMALGIAQPAAQSADRVAEFNKARPELRRGLRSDEPADRIEAIRELEKFAIDDSVTLIVGALADPVPAVREAAYGTLMALNGNQEVCDTLMLLVRKSAKSAQGMPTAAPALAVLLASERLSTQREVNEFLETGKSAATTPELLIYVADELGRHQKAADVAALANLTKTQAFGTHFGVRRAVVSGLTQIPTKEALGALIGVMDRVGGVVKSDVMRHLARVSGQIYGADAEAWQRWWEGAKDTFEYPAQSVETASREMPAETEYGHYYGMPLFGERMVFVLDTSGSMGGERIIAAKRELTMTIKGLAEHAQFSVVVFNGTVGVWQRKLVAANEQSKQSAIAFVNGQRCGSHTASYDALETAFMFDTEAIYFLSDGAPTSGKIRAPTDIVTAVTNANRTRRISIYTIGVGAGMPGGPLDEFLKTLAEQNMGSYRRVDG